MGGIIFGGIVALVINIIIATRFANYASQKGYSYAPYFWACFLLGVIGYCMVAALPDLVLHQKIDGALSKNTFSESNKTKIFSDAKPSVNVASFPKNVDYISGTCELCGSESDKLAYCEIKDSFGTRYRNICADCMTKKNATPKQK